MDESKTLKDLNLSAEDVCEYCGEEREDTYVNCLNCLRKFKPKAEDGNG